MHSGHRQVRCHQTYITSSLASCMYQEKYPLMWCAQVVRAGLATETLQLKEELFRALETGKRQIR